MRELRLKRLTIYIKISQRANDKAGLKHLLSDPRFQVLDFLFMEVEQVADEPSGEVGRMQPWCVRATFVNCKRIYTFLI